MSGRGHGPTRILTVDVTRSPAVITDELPVRGPDGEPTSYDVTGLQARGDGGWWLAARGRTGADNALVRLDTAGRAVQEVRLPDDVAAGLDALVPPVATPAPEPSPTATPESPPAPGLEGLALRQGADGEELWVALATGLPGDPPDTARLGRLDPATSTWSWFAYPLEPPAPQAVLSDPRTVLSEITALRDGRLVVVERDTAGGPGARVKRVYTVRPPATGSGNGPRGEGLRPLTKTLARDLLPDLGAGAGWTPSSVDGLAVGADGVLYALAGHGPTHAASGETVLLRLGTAAGILGCGTRETASR